MKKILVSKNIFKVAFYLISIQCVLVSVLTAMNPSKEGGDLLGLSLIKLFAVILLLLIALILASVIGGEKIRS